MGHEERSAETVVRLQETKR